MINQPRGIRNHNPGNLEWGDPWQGLVEQGKRTDPRFCQFQTPAWGIRAMARVLITYQDKHNIRTVTAAINRWAPPIENDTQAYINQVSINAGKGADEPLDLHNYDDLEPIVQAIIRHENGSGPRKSVNSWYDQDTIDEGLRMAGVRKPVRHATKVPVTKETAGAAATGGVGASQIAEGLPAVADAITQADGHLSSGSVVRVIIGVVLVGIAVFIA
ncbi:MAG TPA: hypothetical protein VK062_05040, partial [Burkholderiaceae bacterium]|nr:hypothetical protein [Burkholderiaceae bacterium]